MKKNKPGFFAKTAKNIKRAFDEFLTVPTIVVGCFLLFAVLTHFADQEQFAWLHSFRMFMKRSVFSNPAATSELLGAIAASLITVSSFTITLLLLVVQQSAASMTTQVFDQFLRNRQNQVIFGFFVGLALYALIILSTVAAPFNPIIGATIAFFLTAIALFLLIILIYTTINEMRPEVIIEAIHRHILLAHTKQSLFISKTRRSSQFEGKVIRPVQLETHGYLSGINLECIKKKTAHIEGETEIIYNVSIGDYIATHDVFAHVKADSQIDCEKMIEAVYDATGIEMQRKITKDPGNGIEQLEMIAWTSVSTAKSNPYPGLLTIRSLRTLLSVWDDKKSDPNPVICPVVYNDNLKSLMLTVLETLGVVSSESMQHQTFTEVLRTFSLLFGRLQPKEQDRVNDIILRLLSAMGDFVLTGSLELELDQLTSILKKNNRNATAMAIQTAKNKLKLSVGKLNSRSTRAGG